LMRKWEDTASGKLCAFNPSFDDLIRAQQPASHSPPVLRPFVIHAPTRPSSTPPTTTASAKPTRASPNRSRSVMRWFPDPPGEVTTFTLQLLLQLVEEPPVGALGEDLLRARFDQSGFGGQRPPAPPTNPPQNRQSPNHSNDQITEGQRPGRRAHTRLARRRA